MRHSKGRVCAVAQIAEPPSPDKAKILSRADYRQLVWQIAWPAIALNSLQVVNSLLDTKFVGSIGRASLNASGAAQSITFLLISLAIALGSGATALVSRFFGAEDHTNMLAASRQSVTLSLVVGIALGGLGTLMLPAMAQLFIHKGSEVYPEMLRYCYPIMAAIPAVYLFNAIAANLRAIGDTKTPMYVSGFQIFLHMVLNFLLIFPPRQYNLGGVSFGLPGAGWGIAGAGWAFAISSWVAAVLYFPASSRAVLGQTWKLQKLAKDWVLRILRIAIPASVMMIIRVSSFAAFAMALQYTREGENALGAMRVGIGMESIAFMPAFGYMVAASALVGQSLGMRDTDRAEGLAWSATMQAVAMMSVMSLVFLVFADPLAGVFVSDHAQHVIAVSYLRIVAITEPLFGFAMVLTGAHQGAGDTVRPTMVAFLSSWVVRVPAVWIFAVYLNGGSTAAWVVMSVTQAINGFLMIYLFKQGRWKTKEI